MKTWNQFFDEKNKVNEELEVELNEIYNIDNYDTNVSINISGIIKFFLEDLEFYIKENDIKITKEMVTKLVNGFKEEFIKKIIKDGGLYYSEKEKYEEITEDSNFEFFGDLIKKYN